MVRECIIKLQLVKYQIDSGTEIKDINQLIKKVIRDPRGLK
jgi:hypothetical protein